ncbi:hypothetical protein [Lacibacter sediminis]|uniref:Uncharacterized protein n=1 Tax=Lacibacter sediminis TaxID=2760713 RepID=A0A7G5XMC3_9BACT|nr:hypothetical protein [Lacibacter sediminis]QNA46626.1 hypothetical protein H4075_10780 [Lacibacter sediminis]
MRNIISQLIQKPKTLFLVDGIGAFITAFLLFAVLRTFNEYVGLPATTLTYLSAVAAGFCIYSISCFFVVKENWQHYLRFISIANLLYCCVTIGLVVYHYPTVTMLGIAYFSGEIIVICALVSIELKALRKRN